jgi:hypothetical protein
MLLRHGIRVRLAGMCARSQWCVRCGKVRAMNPPAPSDERRTVPRHLRDSEHDMSGAAPGSGTRTEDVGGNRRLRGWIYAILAALAVAFSLWIGLKADY